MNARPMAVLAELEGLTTRLRDGADAYVRQVERVAATWWDAGRTQTPPASALKEKPGAGAHYAGAVPGGGRRP